jgi:hypothetical protein
MEVQDPGLLPLSRPSLLSFVGEGFGSSPRWSHSREVVERDFKGVLEDEKWFIVRDDVARLYGLSLS